MKTRIGAIILAVVCLGLVAALFATKKRARDEKTKDMEMIYDYSNKFMRTSSDLDEQRQVNVLLTNDLAARKTEIVTLTNRLTDMSSKLGEVSSKLGEVSTTLEKTAASLKATQDEVARRDARITELESQNAALDQRANDLTNRITSLTGQIDDTKKKLASSEGDKAFLEGELKRLMAEKAEVERQFNDLAVLRAQVAKLKEEVNISRRLDWIRKGLFATSDQKGAQQLIQRGPAVPQSAQHYDLNVEVNADGSVRVIPPLTNNPDATNLPPAK